VGASSEWVVTFPTKRFYVDPAIVGTNPSSYIQPFEEVFGGGFSYGLLDPGVSCFGIGLQYWNREEAQPTTGIVFSPPPITGGQSLCYEAQVITFNQNSVQPGGPDSAILGSDLASNVPTNYTSGWMDLQLGGSAHVLRTSREGNVFTGLPVTGFLVTNYVNTNAAPGLLGNYSGLYRHRFSRNISSVAL